MWVHQPDIDRGDKMDDTARAAVFAGMSEIYKGYIGYFPDTGGFCADINCTFAVNRYLVLETRPPAPPPADMPPVTPLPPVHVQERVRAGPVPEIPLPPMEHKQIQPPVQRGSPATETSRREGRAATRSRCDRATGACAAARSAHRGVYLHIGLQQGDRYRLEKRRDKRERRERPTAPTQAQGQPAHRARRLCHPWRRISPSRRKRRPLRRASI